MAISPEYLHQGVDAQLLEHILILADEIESTVSTEVSPLSAPLYRGFGFQDDGIIGFRTRTGLEHHLVMVRPPDIHQRLKLGVGRGYY
jgi:GNAT superfamily N-acetyltransferase